MKLNKDADCLQLGKCKQQQHGKNDTNNNINNKLERNKDNNNYKNNTLAKIDLRLTGETDQGWTEEEKEDHEGPAGPRSSFHGFSLSQTTQFAYSCPSSLLLAVLTHFLVFYHWVFS